MLVWFPELSLGMTLGNAPKRSSRRRLGGLVSVIRYPVRAVIAKGIGCGIGLLGFLGAASVRVWPIMSRGRGPSDGGDRRRRVVKLPSLLWFHAGSCEHVDRHYTGWLFFKEEWPIFLLICLLPVAVAVWVKWKFM